MINKEIYRLRITKEWTQKKLSEESGIPVATIQAVENGDIGEMSIFRRERVLLELAHTLGVSVESLKEN